MGGPLGVIRVSGARSHAILAALVDEPGTARGVLAEPARKNLRRPLLGAVGETLDDATLARFDAPKSFSGEDGFELFVHGSPAVIHSVLERLFALGARRALPGEFSFRAVKNGKLSLSAAEAVSDLIAAQSLAAARLALEKMSGTQLGAVSELAERLRKTAALSEVGIDFSDQDVEEVSLPVLRKEAREIRAAVARLRESFARGHRLQEGVGISFLGAPNSGKSSLFNALLEEERSIVSETAGTTRDIVRETFNLRLQNGGSITLRLEDTAGIRPTSDAIEAEGIARAYSSASAADLVVWLIDATAAVPVAEPALPTAALLAHPGKCVGLLSKADLVSPAQIDELARHLKSRIGLEIPWLSVSSRTGAGVTAVSEEIATRAAALVDRAPGEVLLTRRDHAEHCADAEAHLERALSAPEIDLFASDLKHALLALEPMIGTTTPDDLLGRIFSQFCIGK